MFLRTEDVVAVHDQKHAVLVGDREQGGSPQTALAHDGRVALRNERPQSPDLRINVLSLLVQRQLALVGRRSAEPFPCGLPTRPFAETRTARWNLAPPGATWELRDASRFRPHRPCGSTNRLSPGDGVEDRLIGSSILRYRFAG